MYIVWVMEFSKKVIFTEESDFNVFATDGIKKYGENPRWRHNGMGIYNILEENL